MPTVLKSGSLNLLEPSGLVQACNGVALPAAVTFPRYCWFVQAYGLPRVAGQPLIKKNSKLQEKSHKTEGIPSIWGVTKSTSEIRQVDMRVEILTGDAKA